MRLDVLYIHIVQRKVDSELSQACRMTQTQSGVNDRIVAVVARHIPHMTVEARCWRIASCKMILLASTALSCALQPS